MPGFPVVSAAATVAALSTGRRLHSSFSSSTSTPSPSSVNPADAPAAVGGEKENIYSGPKDALYASKIAHLLREKVYSPDFQSTNPNLSDKEAELLRMWREAGNNPALDKKPEDRAGAGNGNGAGAAMFSETGAMDSQTTSWEGSAAMSAAAEALRMEEAKLKQQATHGEQGGGGRSQFSDEAPVNVAEAYGQNFRDSRPIDPNEGVEDKRRRLIYQSRYRGMVEMDLILGHFARLRLTSLDAAMLDEYDTLLKQLDNDLFRWIIMDLERPPEIEQMKCFHELKTFVKKEREQLLSSI